MTKAIDHQDIVKTVRIHVKPSDGNPEGICEINASDYDEKKHKLVDGEQTSLDLTDGDKGGSSIVGSGKFDAMLDVGAVDEKKQPVLMALGVVVGLAHSDSGKTISEWNALPEDSRDALIAGKLAAIRAKNGYKPPAPFK